MGKSINWNRARKFKSTEPKYEHGKVMDNGEVIVHQQDSLAKRAARAEREWLKSKARK